jgi:hypothetical protein
MTSRPIVALFLLSLTVSACASGGSLEKRGWTFLAKNGDDSLYMKAEGKPTGAVHQVWTAYDLLTVRDRKGFSFQSVESLGEYDCAQHRSRVVRETFHAKAALRGKTWADPKFIPTQWADSTGSLGDMKLEFACKD